MLSVDFVHSHTILYSNMKYYFNMSVLGIVLYLILNSNHLCLLYILRHTRTSTCFPLLYSPVIVFFAADHCRYDYRTAIQKGTFTLVVTYSLSMMISLIFVQCKSIKLINTCTLGVLQENEFIEHGDLFNAATPQPTVGRALDVPWLFLFQFDFSYNIIMYVFS